MNIMIVLIALSFNLTNLSGKDQDRRTILWNEHIKLTWDDFKGEPLPKEKRGFKTAITCYDLIITADFLKGEVPDFSVRALFIINESWTITDSDDVLAHEQVHFDLAELYARKIRERFYELQESKELEQNVYLNEYYRLRKELDNYNRRYDSEVYFNKAKQQEWIDNVHKELEELKDYEYVPDE